jgi:hypothetical protein
LRAVDYRGFIEEWVSGTFVSANVPETYFTMKLYFFPFGGILEP